MLTLTQALQWIPGAQLVGDGSIQFHRVHTDTRSLQPGDLFVALRGDRFDANDFLAKAAQDGACAALAHVGRLPKGMAGLEVPDTRRAMGQLAAGWRGQFRLPLIAVTGSNGKTTVTQMVASILRAWQGEKTFSTLGNLNNDIGLPLTLLRLRETHTVGVVELGMNHPGEIAYLAGLAKPTIALVNNAQREHQEFMATVEAVAHENAQSFTAMDERGVTVYPADDAFTPLWDRLSGDRVSMTFTDRPDDAQADVRGQGVWVDGRWEVSAQTPCGPLTFPLRIAGRHNVRNALAAAACALTAGAPLAAIGRGLAGFEPVNGRSKALAIHWRGRAMTLIDDTYNANPDSVRAAIDVLAELPGPQLLVLGDMGEVGDQGPAFHAEVGAYARARNLTHVYTLGEQAVDVAGQHFGDIDALIAAVVRQMDVVCSVLVKGSRFMKMERVVEAITQEERATFHAA